MMQSKTSKDSSRGFPVSSEINFLISIRKTLPTLVKQLIWHPKIFILETKQPQKDANPGMVFAIGPIFFLVRIQHRRDVLMRSFIISSFLKGQKVRKKNKEGETKGCTWDLAWPASRVQLACWKGSGMAPKFAAAFELKPARQNIAWPERLRRCRAIGRCRFHLKGHSQTWCPEEAGNQSRRQIMPRAQPASVLTTTSRRATKLSGSSGHASPRPSPHSPHIPACSIVCPETYVSVCCQQSRRHHSTI